MPDDLEARVTRIEAALTALYRVRLRGRSGVRWADAEEREAELDAALEAVVAPMLARPSGRDT